MGAESGLLLTWGLAGASLLLVVVLLVAGRRGHVDQRLADLGGASGSEAFGGMAIPPGLSLAPRLADSEVARRMRDEEKKNRIRARIVQAGLYKRYAMALFIGLRITLAVLPVVAGAILGRYDVVPLSQGLLFGAAAGLFGTLAPSFWLDRLKRQRQTKIRRALPDALDVIVVCLEGGLSLSGSLSRVARELAMAHPMLALELGIVEREVQMGRTTGEALREFAKRFDLEELRSLASVISQTERFGASVVKALSVYADTMRLKRSQRAEELAQKASIKILFPTLLCIFPGIFVVLLGPAAIQVYNVLIKGVMRGVG